MRTPPHPLAEALAVRVRMLATTLRPASIQNYRRTVSLFMAYLRQQYPNIRQASQLKRDPHILGWLEFLWTRRVTFTGLPLSPSSRAGHLLRLRKLFELMADHRFPPRPGLLWSQDVPRSEEPLPRPLTPEQDELLKTQLRQRNDPFSNALLLTRLTGMRPGETADLRADCLRESGERRWVLHVPAVKILRERWIPVDDEVRTIVARLSYLRTLPATHTTNRPAEVEEFLLPRPKGRQEVGKQLRATLLDAATQCGINTRIVPYQLRHTFATSMLRAGVSLPALMKLLGHKKAQMTLRYLEITQQDLHHELEVVRLNPRHLVPTPPLACAEIDASDAPAVILRLDAAIRVLELYRQQAQADNHKTVKLLSRRLVRIRSNFQKLTSTE